MFLFFKETRQPSQCIEFTKPTKYEIEFSPSRDIRCMHAWIQRHRPKQIYDLLERMLFQEHRTKTKTKIPRKNNKKNFMTFKSRERERVRQRKKHCVITRYIYVIISRRYFPNRNRFSNSIIRTKRNWCI